MRYYTSTQYTGKTKKKRILRAVLLTSLSLGILIGAAMLGNLLRDRLVRAENLLSLSPADYAVREETTAPPQFKKPPRRRQAVETVACSPIAADAFQSKDSLTAALSGLSGGGISVTVSDAEGARFAFDAIPTNGSLPDPRLLTAAAEAAAIADTHLSATVCSSHSAAADGDLLAELVLCGVRDVVLYGLTGDTLSPTATYTLLIYLDHLRDRAPDTAIGIALSPALFRDADAAAQLDQLAEYFDYLALDLTERPAQYDDVSDYVDAVSAELYGSIDYYKLAVLTDAEGISPEALSLWEDAGVRTVRSLS